ncbi:MAG: N-acetylmuramoyl-L-alanine amidase [Pseudomonadota bacterium]
MRIEEHPSPNYGPRRDGGRPRLIVLHYTAMESAAAALARLSDPAAEVSAHYLIGREGAVWRLVAEEMRAWHAGAGAWGEVADVNSQSLGIELDNAGDAPFPAVQMRALEALLADLRARWAIEAKGVIAHSDMAPGRKHDPGPHFAWRRLALGGQSIWPVDIGTAPADMGRFQAASRRVGYRPPAGTAGWAAVLAAFRLRFRPDASGPLAPADVALMEALARDHPAVAPAAEGA